MLSQKLSVLQEISVEFSRTGKIELNGVVLEIGTLSSDEDAFAQSWSMGIVGEGPGFTSYYKLAVVALAIKKLDDIDISVHAPEDFIETGEVNDLQKPKKKQRFKLMIDVVRSLNPEITNWIFEKYSTMAVESSKQIREEIQIEEIGEIPKEDEKQSKRELTKITPSEGDQEVNEDEISEQLKKRYENS